jgi:hypothetical protein
VIFVVANFLQMFWRKTLKNVGFWQKLAPTLLKQKKKWKKGKNTDFAHFAIPMMYLVTQFVFGWRVISSFAKMC